MRISDWSSDVCSSDLGQHRLPPKRLVRLAIVGIGIVARQPHQHRRHPECERNFPRRSSFQPDEIHIRRRHAHRLPLEATLKQHRPPRIARALKSRFKSEEHTSELQSLMRNSYAVFCLNKKKRSMEQYGKTKWQTDRLQRPRTQTNISIK